jgi:small nuclear ribonucleoprotein (snRNP)-like protein
MIGQDLIGKFVIVITKSSGVFAGILENRAGKEVELKEGIRILDNAQIEGQPVDEQLKEGFRVIRWKDTYAVSEIAVEGIHIEASCFLGQPMEKIVLLDCIEIIEASKKSEDSIREYQKRTNIKLFNFD